LASPHKRRPDAGPVDCLAKFGLSVSVHRERGDGLAFHMAHKPRRNRRRLVAHRDVKRDVRFKQRVRDGLDKFTVKNSHKASQPNI
jgi:hypothetical protein